MRTLREHNQIISQHQQAWPVQMVPLARDLGIPVYRRSDWPDNISGRIFRSQELGGDSGFAIEVNEKHHPNRRRYTIAHEIAHFVLHNDLIGDELYDDGLYRSGLSSAVERQADRFAADLLMPPHLIYNAMREHGRNVAVLAREFQVSERAMGITLGVPDASY